MKLRESKSMANRLQQNNTNYKLKTNDQTKQVICKYKVPLNGKFKVAISCPQFKMRFSCCKEKPPFQNVNYAGREIRIQSAHLRVTFRSTDCNICLCENMWHSCDCSVKSGWCRFTDPVKIWHKILNVIIAQMEFYKHAHILENWYTGPKKRQRKHWQ